MLLAVFQLLLPLAAEAEGFTFELARSSFSTAAKPAFATLEGGSWLAIGGVEGKAGSGFLPLGFDEKGLNLPAAPSPVGFKSSQRIVEFREAPLDGKKASFADFYTLEKYKSQIGEGNLEFSEKGAVFSLKGAKFECRQRSANLLLCAATAAAGADPVASTAAYFLLLRRSGSPVNQLKGALPTEQQVMGRGFKCVMKWKGGKVERMSFTLTSKPFRVGRLTLYGVGGAWSEGEEENPNRVVVLKIEPGVGSHSVYTIFKPNSPAISESTEIQGSLFTSTGLLVAGTLDIPEAGGETGVVYPPGPGQSREDYAKTLLSAPSASYCVAVKAPEPTNPYLIHSGIIK